MLKKALYYIVNTLSVIIIVAALVVLLSALLTGQNEAPNVFGYSVFRVVTGSMEPEIEKGDLIVVKRTEPSEIAVGDVISFYSQDPELMGAVNTHRVTGIETDEGDYLFTTKGDANLIQDKYPVSASYLIGLVVFSSGLLGRVSRIIANPLVFVPLILLPLLVILLTNLTKTVRLAKEAVRREEEQAIADAVAEIKRRKAEKQNDADDVKESVTGVQAQSAQPDEQI